MCKKLKSFSSNWRQGTPVLEDLEELPLPSIVSKNGFCQNSVTIVSLLSVQPIRQKWFRTTNRCRQSVFTGTEASISTSAPTRSRATLFLCTRCRGVSVLPWSRGRSSSRILSKVCPKRPSSFSGREPGISILSLISLIQDRFPMREYWVWTLERTSSLRRVAENFLEEEGFVTHVIRFCPSGAACSPTVLNRRDNCWRKSLAKRHAASSISITRWANRLFKRPYEPRQERLCWKTWRIFVKGFGQAKKWEAVFTDGRFTNCKLWSSTKLKVTVSRFSMSIPPGPARHAPFAVVRVSEIATCVHALVGTNSTATWMQVALSVGLPGLSTRQRAPYTARRWQPVSWP